MKNLNHKYLSLLILCIFCIIGLCKNVNGQNTNGKTFDSIANFDEAEFKSTANFNGAVFKSTANFSVATFDSTAEFVLVKFDSTAEFNGVQFASTADFNDALFDSTADFNCAVFKSTANFNGAVFKSTADFTATIFFLTSDFHNIKIDSTSYFDNPEFKSIASFYKAVFKSRASFTEAVFESKSNFCLAEFDSITFFSDAVFKSTANFTGAVFNSTPYFTGAKFDSIANFDEAEFKSTANFNGAVFKSTANFDYTLLPDILDFQSVTSKETIDFTNAVLNSTKKAQDKDYRCLINLLGTDISKIKINCELFKLYFPFGSNITDEQKISIYEKLLKKFKDDGFMESYKNLDIEYKDFVYKSHKDYILNWFQKTWWNYGYSKERVIYWSFGILFLLTLINLKQFDKMQNHVYKIDFNFYKKEDFEEKINNPNTTKFQKLWNILLFKFFNPLVYTAIIFFGVSIKIERFQKFSGLVLYVWTIYTIGLFCLAYIFNIIIVK